MSFKLLQEYAVDPACVTGWHALQLLVAGFGIPKGRIISRFPKDWQRQVYDRLATSGSVNDSRVEIALKRLGKAVVPTGRPKKLGKPTFIDSALTEHLSRPFTAILAEANPNDHSRVLMLDELHDDHELWQASTEQAVPRRAECYLEALGELLRSCTELRLVDPHFHPKKQRFQRPLKEIASQLRLKKFQYHVHESRDWGIADFERDCHNELEYLVPQGVTVEMVIWSCKPGGQDFHARYVLTDKGGVRVEQGLDDNVHANTTTDMSLLSEALHTQRRQDFDADSETAA